MGIVIDIHDPNETKMQRFERKAKEKYNKAKEWCVDHIDEIVALAPMVVGGIAGTAKIVGKICNTVEEKNLKDKYIYDRSMGRYIELRRKLNQKDLVEISKRRNNGERLTDILISMKLVR